MSRLLPRPSGLLSARPSRSGTNSRSTEDKVNKHAGPCLLSFHLIVPESNMSPPAFLAQPKPRASEGVQLKWYVFCFPPFLFLSLLTLHLLPPRLDGVPSANSHTTEFGAPWAKGEIFKCASLNSDIPWSRLADRLSVRPLSGQRRSPSSTRTARTSLFSRGRLLTGQTAL